MGTSQERRLCRESNATWTGPLCEACPPAGVEEQITRKRIASELGRSRVRPEQSRFWSASGRENRKPMMNEHGKPDPAVVAGKLANNAEQSAAEPVELRAGTKGNANQQHAGRTQSR